MKTLYNSIIFEYSYLKYKKIFWMMIIFLALVNVLAFYMMSQYISSSYNEYRYAQDVYKENPNQETESDSYEIIQNKDGTTTVSNPLLYHFDQVSKSLFVASPQYCVAQVLEIGFILLPFLFCSLGVFLANSDKKNGVYKHKILRFGRENYFISKLIIGAGAICVGVLFMAFLGKVIDIPFYAKICEIYPVEEFELGIAEMLSTDFTKIILIILIGLALYSMAFALTTVTNNATISLLIVILYNYLAPVKVSYGIKNCCRALMVENFDLYGVVSISGVKSINSVLAILVLILTILSCQIVSFVLIKKRSAYI